VSCSATAVNPEGHIKAIFGINRLKLIDYDGSPSGRKEHVSWNLSLRALDDPTSGRMDGVAEAARLFSLFILKGARVLAFCKTRISL
jgi:DEAD/DEAH box helicase domain-containing protein